VHSSTPLALGDVLSNPARNFQLMLATNRALKSAIACSGVPDL